MTSGGVNHVYGFPPRLITRLRYCDTYSLTSTAGSLAKQVMYINSTFDPDNSGTGHQPAYRDTYATLYNHYAVISAKVKVTFVSNSATSSMLVGCKFDDDNTTSSTATTLMEESTGQHLLLPNNAGSISCRTLSFNWSCEKQLGINPYASETYKTLVTSNPSEIAAFLIWAQPIDGSSTTVTSVLVDMEQEVLFTELTTIIGS